MPDLELWQWLLVVGFAWATFLALLVWAVNRAAARAEANKVANPKCRHAPMEKKAWLRPMPWGFQALATCRICYDDYVVAASHNIDLAPGFDGNLSSAISLPGTDEIARLRRAGWVIEDPQADKVPA